MKYKYIITIGLAAVLASACQDLDLEPKGFLDETSLFGNEFGVKKYLAQVYSTLPVEDFTYYGSQGDDRGNNNNTRWTGGNKWEIGKNSLGNVSGEQFNYWKDGQSQGIQYWPYDRIRSINTFIVNFPNYKNQYVESIYNNLLGEAYCLRAFYYFAMAKRYGGVPLVTDIQDPTADPTTLQVARNTEDETYQFIHDDLEKAYTLMAYFADNSRISKYTAAALMSRAMLYAGRIAKYTQYAGISAAEKAVADKLVGIDESRASYYYGEALKYAKYVVESGKYSLYSEYGDKAENFSRLFVDRTSSEDIFVKYYNKNAIDGGLKHSYNACMVPNPDFSVFVGLGSSPYLEEMMLFDFPKLLEDDGTPIRWDNKEDIKKHMEPRLRGSMFFTGDLLRGKYMDFHRGIYKTFHWKWGVDYPGEGGELEPANNSTPANRNGNVMYLYDRTTAPEAIYNYTPLAHYNATYHHTADERIPIAGFHGMRHNEIEANSQTGSTVRKYIDPDVPVSQANVNNDETPWKELRLGEVLINGAEAAYETGDRTTAQSYVDQLRERGGSSKWTMAASAQQVNVGPYSIDANLKFIRDERLRELLFENHYWWDLKTWRVVNYNYFYYALGGTNNADGLNQLQDAVRPHYLSAFYVLDEGKWIYLPERNKDQRTWRFTDKNAFYQGIPGGEINKNPLLVQNPMR